MRWDKETPRTRCIKAIEQARRGEPITAGFALFRMPDANVCTFIYTRARVEEYVRMADVPTTGGYVIAPFAVAPDAPLLFIRPEEVVSIPVEEGEDEQKTCSFDEGDRVNELCSQLISTAEEENGNCLHSNPKGEKANEFRSLSNPKAEKERSAYASAFAAAHDRLADGRLQKVVLARSLRIESQEALDAYALFMRACRQCPHSYVALWHTPQSGTWLVATPEILLECNGGQARTMALAGTLPFQPEQTPEWSRKNRNEQDLVRRYIAERLDDLGLNYETTAPFSHRCGQLLHLCSRFHFRLSPEREAEVVEALHPTPAVCGLPLERAQRFIRRAEHFPRRYYAGFSGLYHYHNTTALFVSLRCMDFGLHYANLYAGGGLMPDSREDDEWEETERKLQTMKDVLR